MSNNNIKPTGYSLIILAGSRPGGDPLAKYMDVPGKALIQIDGEAMISHVVRQFHKRKDIAGIHIVTELEDAFREHPTAGWVGKLGKVQFHKNAGSIAGYLSQIFDGGKMNYPAIVTTADNPLITPAMIDQFLSTAQGSDVGIALVERKILDEKYPDNKRTWIKFKGGQYSGANLFLLGSDKAQKIISLWAKVEQDRKKGWRVLTMLGPWLLMLILLRLIGIHNAAKRASAKIGLNITIAELDQAEACIDVDKPEDIILAETIMQKRKD